MENNCQEIREQILELIAGTLPAEKAAAVQHHLSECPACCEYLQALQADDKLLGDFAEAMQPTVARLENNVTYVLNREESRKPVISIPIWKTIIKSRIARFAAATVMIIAICLFLTQYGPNKQVETQQIVRTTDYPAKLTTLATLSFAYRQGGMEMVEQMCDKALKMAGQRPANISLQEFFEEINNGKSERTKL